MLMTVAVAAVCTSAALAWGGRPTVPAPKPATAAGPPPAWAETATRSVWLAYSGYCWKTSCADYLPPASRPDLPTISVARGRPVRLHLVFQPTKVTVAVLGATTSTSTLAAMRVVTWRPTRSGVVTFSVKAPAGSVGYAAKIHVR